MNLTSFIILNLSARLNTYKNEPPVLYLAIRLQSEDLKHLIPIPEHPDYRFSINYCHLTNKILLVKFIIYLMKSLHKQSMIMKCKKKLCKQSSD